MVVKVLASGGETATAEFIFPNGAKVVVSVGPKDTQIEQFDDRGFCVEAQKVIAVRG